MTCLRLESKDGERVLARLAARRGNPPHLRFWAPQFAADADDATRLRAARDLLCQLSTVASDVAYLETPPADDVESLDLWLAALIEAGFSEIERANEYARDLADPVPDPAPLTLRAVSALPDRGALYALLDAASPPTGVPVQGAALCDELARNNLVAADPDLWWVACVDEALVGCVFVGMERAENAGHILHIAVHPAWRQQGLGRALLRSGLHALRQAGASKALALIDAGNHPSRALHQSERFVRQPGDFMVYRKIAGPG